MTRQNGSVRGSSRKGAMAAGVATVTLILMCLSVGGASPVAASDDGGESSQSEVREALIVTAEMFAAEYGVSVEEAVDRLDRQEAMLDAIPAIMSMDPDGFGGSWIDHRDAGSVHLAFLERPSEEELRTALARSDAETLVEHVSVHEVDHSLATLLSTYDRLIPLHIRWASSGIENEVSLSVAENIVEVRVRGGGDEAPAVVREAVASLPVRIAELTGDVVALTCANRQDCSNETQMRAGLRLDLTGCTAGFTSRNTAGSRYTLTAGHCYPGGGGSMVETHGTERMGGIPYSSVNAPGSDTIRTVDVARIFLDGASYYTGSRWVWHQEAQRHPVIESATQTDLNNSLGHWVCNSGVTSGTRCGSVSDVLITTSFRNDNDDLESYSHTFQYGANACGGDSGGSAHRSATYNTEAYGITSHGAGSAATATNGQPCFTDARAGRIPNVEALTTTTVLIN